MKHAVVGFLLAFWSSTWVLGQSDGVAKDVERLESSLLEVRELGEIAGRALGKARRSDRDGAWVYAAVRRSLETVKPVTGLAGEDVAPRVRRLTKALRAVINDGMEAASRLRIRIGELERERGARGGETKGSAASFLIAMLGRTADSVVATAARKAMKAKGGGVYLGMWEAERAWRAHYLEGFRLILQDIAAPENQRILAADAIGQLTLTKNASERTRMIGVCRAVLDSKSPVPPSGVRDAAAFALARLGDRGPLLSRVRPIMKQLQDLAHQESPDANRILGLQLELAALYMGAYEYENATRAYASALGILYQNVTYDRTSVEGRAEIANALYNLACTLARSGRTQKAVTILDQAFAWGLRSFAWCRKDGDLATLRASSRLEPLITAWETGEKKPGQGILPASNYLKLMAAFLPGAKPSK